MPQFRPSLNATDQVVLLSSHFEECVLPEIRTIFRSYYRPKRISIFRPKCLSLCPASNQNGAKTLSFGAARSYIAYVRDYPPHPIPTPPHKANAVMKYSTMLLLQFFRLATQKSQEDYGARKFSAALDHELCITYISQNVKKYSYKPGYLWSCVT